MRKFCSCSAEIPKDEEFLESVISAVRSLLQIMASTNTPQVKNTPKFKPDIKEKRQKLNKQLNSVKQCAKS